jgi:quercetin dioxygenase-like cupin family protein
VARGHRGAAEAEIAAVSVYRPLEQIAPLPIWDGILARIVEGREITLATVELAPHAVARRHQHANEQLGIVLKGSITFDIGGETRLLAAGDTYEIPSNVPHEATAGPDGAVVIDVFAPIRADWHRLTPTEPRAPLWP